MIVTQSTLSFLLLKPSAKDHNSFVVTGDSGIHFLTSVAQIVALTTRAVIIGIESKLSIRFSCCFELTKPRGGSEDMIVCQHITLSNQINLKRIG